VTSGALPSTLALPFTLDDVIREQEKRAGYKMRAYYPATGLYRRALYPKHVAFIHAGAHHRERLFLAGNQTGKTDLGAYETTCHLTGQYPDWWCGKRFDHPTRGWAAGDTGKTLRDILTVKLIGLPGLLGTGMVPAHAIQKTTWRAPDTLDTVEVAHCSGGTSYLALKSYDQRRESFQGTTLDFIWLDEEPPSDIYTECLLRTMTTDGVVYMTFTPLQGWTKLLDEYTRDAETITV
jgi:phage terminase large subunit-like protein